MSLEDKFRIGGLLVAAAATVFSLVPTASHASPRLLQNLKPRELVEYLEEAGKRAFIRRERNRVLFTYEEWVAGKTAYEAWLKESEKIYVRETEKVKAWRERGRNPNDPDWKLIREKVGLICENTQYALNLLPSEDKKIYKADTRLIRLDIIFEKQYLLDFYGVQLHKHPDASILTLYLDQKYNSRQLQEKGIK
jgi:DNA polymerase elongation subunit (family B)